MNTVDIPLRNQIINLLCLAVLTPQKVGCWLVRSLADSFVRSPSLSFVCD